MKTEAKEKNRSFALEMQNKLRKRRGQPLLEVVAEPEAEETIVGLPAHLLWIWESFAILSRTRLVNETGPQPITVLELDSYCSLEGFWSEWERRELLHHITLLDIEWLKVTHANLNKSREDARKKAEKDAKNKGNKGRR